MDGNAPGVKYTQLVGLSFLGKDTKAETSRISMCQPDEDMNDIRKGQKLY